jgi:membrane protein implicated in regulation of membrane protease activity
MWRKRLLALRDRLVLAAIFGGVIGAGLVLAVRLQVLHMPVWQLLVGTFGLSLAAAVIHWFFNRASERESAFLIDESLNLDDRVATAHSIIERGGPRGAIEDALVEDTAERAGSKPASSVIPVRMRPWHAFALLSMAALIGVLMVAPRVSSVVDPLTAERAEINQAAEHLERTSEEVEQTVPDGTETSRLAREQAELGRGFRRSTTSRAEALKKLSALEERIRLRHDDLVESHADEIVTMADRRLGSALSTLTPKPNPESQADEAKLTASEDAATGRPKAEPSADTPASGKNSKQANAVEPQNRPQEPASGKDGPTDSDHKPQEARKSVDASSKPASDRIDLKSKDQNQKAQNQTEQGAQHEKDGEQSGDKSTSAADALKATPESLTNQAAKTVPGLSEDLLKKAAQLRANELSPGDIEKLRKAAELLSGDLAKIAQSEEMQQALREMARQVTPEQIEQVARELGKNEKLRQELQSAARLLMENQKAKEMVAGLAGELARARDDLNRNQHDESDRLQTGSNIGKDKTGTGERPLRGVTPKSGDRSAAAPDHGFAGQGKETSLQGKPQKGARGEYLYLQSKAGSGAARAPYSSAYPQYRREAERSVQRTQVPSSLRSVVRKYFDAINPDSKK